MSIFINGTNTPGYLIGRTARRTRASVVMCMICSSSNCYITRTIKCSRTSYRTRESYCFGSSKFCRSISISRNTRIYSARNREFSSIPCYCSACSIRVLIISNEKQSSITVLAFNTDVTSFIYIT